MKRNILLFAFSLLCYIPCIAKILCMKQSLRNYFSTGYEFGIIFNGNITR